MPQHRTRVFILKKMCYNASYWDSFVAARNCRMMTAFDGNLHYLTPADLYAIAEEVLGRKPDVRDRRLLQSAAARPLLAAFGTEAYPSLYDKAAALLHSLAAHHLFFDGNKRTATAAVTRFLTLNGIQPTWEADGVYQFVLEIAQHLHDVPAIAQWLATNTQSEDGQ